MADYFGVGYTPALLVPTSVNLLTVAPNLGAWSVIQAGEIVFVSCLLRRYGPLSNTC